MHTSWFGWGGVGFGGGGTLGSPAGTDGVSSRGMITGRMEVRNQQGREGGRKGGRGEGRWRMEEGRNDHSGLVAGKEMERRSDIRIDLERIRVIRGEGERSAGRQEG